MFNLVIAGLILIFLAWFLGYHSYNPFDPPSIEIKIDLSGKRQPIYEEYVEDWINHLKNPRRDLRQKVNQALASWSSDCKEDLASRYIWKRHRLQQYQDLHDQALDPDYQWFHFIFFRRQTRYQQQNYQRTSYQVENVEETLSYSLPEIFDLDDNLNKIDYATTTIKYHAKNQRRLMTRELRETIMERDNYTCQICGKYMPDEVGLHIDHIIPIKEGGKSVESNLQVLCDKCNLSKGKKIVS